MNILAIDTVTENCSVALGLGDEVFQLAEKGNKIHSRLVLGMIDTILDQYNLGLSDLDCLVVDTGPGSFTGVRIGLGVVQGLAYAMKIPVLGINSLEILAFSSGEGKVLPLIDARMGQVYCAYYEISMQKAPHQLWAPMVIHPADVSAEIDRDTRVAGNGWLFYENEFSEDIRNKVRPDSSAIFPQARHAVAIAREFGLERAQSPLKIEASYVRNNVTSISRD